MVGPLSSVTTLHRKTNVCSVTAGPEVSGFLSGADKTRPSVLQNSDVWALGCVYSVAATYVVLGSQGVLLYELVRREALRKKGIPGDAFHDGTDVLVAVTMWHEYLRNVCRRTDKYTPSVLNLVDEGMLVAEGNRESSEQVHAHLDNIVSDLSKTSDDDVPSDIGAILQNIDIGAEKNCDQSLGISRGDTEEAVTITLDDADASTVKFKSQQALYRQGIQPTAQRSLQRGGSMAARRRPSTGTPQFSHEPDYRQSTTEKARHSREVTEVIDEDSIAPEQQVLRTPDPISEAPVTIWTVWEELERIKKGRTVQKKSGMSSIGGSLRSAFKKSHPSSKKETEKMDELEKWLDGRDIVSPFHSSRRCIGDGSNLNGSP
jgi:serine/threonine protein kinase